MTWEDWVCVLMRYYPGLNYLNIPKMTVWQFANAISRIGLLESKTQGSQDSRPSAEVALGRVPGEVPSISNIRAMAKRINPNLKIPPGE